MRHRHSRLRLRHKPAYSRAMQRNLVTSVLLYESIRTTKKRAEVVQPIVEKLITTAKKKDARNAIRAINAFVMHENASKKLMEVLKQRYSGKTSGFTRMTPLGMRVGDGAKMVTLELISDGVAPAAPEETAKKAPKAKKTSKVSA